MIFCNSYNYFDNHDNCSFIEIFFLYLWSNLNHFEKLIRVFSFLPLLSKNIFLVTISILFFSHTAYSQQKTIRAHSTSTPPVIDGFLNESEWEKMEGTDDFLQQEPRPGSQPTFQSEVKILYDQANLYVGIMCYDNEPEKIIARELKWDGRISGDDNFKIIFDTFNDKRSAYWFGTNPLGAQDDALLSGSSYEEFNEDWDGIWEVKSQILTDGWSAEFLFPFSTFKFRDVQEQVWGINFQRGIRRMGEEVQWTAVGENFDFLMIAEAGELIGIENIKRGDPVYLMPYFSAGTEITKQDRNFVNKPGLDIKYGITETLSLDVTLNTDFAQVESDRERINLTRFPLFFPEKREFFLEGAKSLEFSLGNNNDVFYSRRIGLREGEEIPIIAGAKLVGRLNKFEVGFLTVQASAKGDEPTNNQSVGRIKYDLFEQSSLGFIVTNKISKNGFNRVLGGDLLFRFNDFLGDKNLIVGTAVAKSDDNNGDKNSWGGRFFVEYPNDLIDQTLAYGFIQGNFNPEMGFIRRLGIQQLEYDLEITPRINWNGIKKLVFQPLDARLIYNSNHELAEADFSFVPFGFSTIEGDQLEFSIDREFDLVEEEFELFDSTYIQPGGYWFTSYEGTIESAISRPVYGEIQISSGNYYTGKKKSVSTEITLLVNKNLSIGGDYTYNDISLEDNSFSTTEIGSRMRYDFSTMINSSLFAQWNNELNQLNMNLRFNWKPKIGSDFYLVVNQLISIDGKIKSERLTILGKFVWMFIM